MEYTGLYGANRGEVRNEQANEADDRETGLQLLESIGRWNNVEYEAVPATSWLDSHWPMMSSDIHCTHTGTDLSCGTTQRFSFPVQV